MENCQFEERMNELWTESETLNIPESDVVEHQRALEQEKVMFQ
jgi:hypothetical protein